ncbi:MAG: hypothetical protein RL757_1855 [Bacteroidota bacterium]|jgi:hypothetical protein
MQRWHHFKDYQMDKFRHCMDNFPKPLFRSHFDEIYWGGYIFDYFSKKCIFFISNFFEFLLFKANKKK